MNKNLLTQIISLLLVVIGFIFKLPLILSVGLFAFSGGITNWLAIYMLFEKVPGLYGSGVVPAHFQEFKRGISYLLMQQFFTIDNIERFLKGNSAHPVPHIAFDDVIATIDLNQAFDAFVNVIMESSFGSMLNMLGGPARLEGLREPFVEKLKIVMQDIAQSDEFQQAVQNKLTQTATTEKMHEKIAAVIEHRLDELTPQMVKQMVEDMIRQHLGWLVVWGAVFGGLIGLFAGILELEFFKALF
ncbi:MAG: DUF445 family protein [Gammaproteobacteria bacterium]|jgi:uncharacterized membrane protein YheB (UPF0754 family)